MNPFQAVAGFARSPAFRRVLPLAGAAALGGVGDEAVEGMVERHDSGVRDEAARELMSALIDTQEQQAAMLAQQQAAYMQGADDTAVAIAQGIGDEEDYGSYDTGGDYVDDDYLGSGDGMYSLAMAALPPMSKTALAMPKPKAPAGGAAVVAPGPNSQGAPAPPPAGPGIHVKKASAVIGEIPYVLAEALGMSKEAISPAIVGAAFGGGAGFAQGGDNPARFRNALLGAVLGGTAGKVVGDPTTRARLLGLVGGGA